MAWAALGTLAAGATVLAVLPATWVAEVIANRSAQRILLADASGTVWNGTATLALTAGGDSQQATVLPGRLRWKLAFLPLLTGRAILDIAHDTALASTVRITATPTSWNAGAGVLTMPASMLSGIGAPFNTLRPDGRMQVSWNPLAGTLTGQQGWQGTATIRLDRFASSLSPLRPLGSYVAQVRWQDQNGTLTLSTLKGPLTVQGSGTIGRNARFEGTAEATPDTAAQLNGLLSLMGKREGPLTQLRF